MTDDDAKRPRRPRGDGALYQRQNGLWVASVELPDRDGQRRRKQVSSMSYDKCLQKLRAARRDVEDGLEPVSDRATLKTWLTEWLEHIAPREVKPTTMTAYRSAVNAQIIPAIGNKKLGKLAPRDVRGMIDRVQATKSTGTAVNCYWVLKKALDAAMHDGLIRYNVCNQVRKPTAVRESRGTHPVDEVKKLLAHLVERADIDLTARWSLSLFTGARQAECLGLEWDRVDFASGVVDYSWTLQWLRLGQRYGRGKADDTLYARERFDVDPGFDFRPLWRTACLIPPKTAGSRRIVPMVAPLQAALQIHAQNGMSPLGLVWVRSGDRPYRKSDDEKRWHDTLAAAGVPDLTLHSARHTVATLLQEAKVPESVRMAILGHSTVAMARHYAHVDQSLTREALGELNAMLKLD